jgi:hypothetical protein
MEGGMGRPRDVDVGLPSPKVIHPLGTPVTAPQVLSESRKDAVYPGKWRGLQQIEAMNTEFRVEPDCEQPSGKATGNKTVEAPDDSGREAGPPEAARDFEASAVAAVKAWRFRPGTQNGVPVAAYYTLIVDFTSCSTSPKSPNARPLPSP